MAKKQKTLAEELTYKQFLFAEHYLANHNAEAALRHAYPKCASRQATNILKSRKLVAYIKERLEEKKVTIERLTDKTYTVLYSALDDRAKSIRLEATKQVARLNEVRMRIEELDKQLRDTSNVPQQITFNVLNKEMDEA